MGLWSSGRVVQWNVTTRVCVPFSEIFSEFSGYTHACMLGGTTRECAPEATPPNLLFACVRMRTRVCVRVV
jgi:hypothetical protein